MIRQLKGQSTFSTSHQIHSTCLSDWHNQKENIKLQRLECLKESSSHSPSLAFDITISFIFTSSLGKGMVSHFCFNWNSGSISYKPWHDLGEASLQFQALEPGTHWWLRPWPSTEGGTGSVPGGGSCTCCDMWPKKKKKKIYIYLYLYLYLYLYM